MNEAVTIELVFAVIAAASIVYGWVKSRHDGSTEVLNRLTQLETRQKADREALLREVQLLRSDIEKHNSVIERTFKLESDVNTVFKRIDEHRERIERIESIKIGGTE